MFCLTSVTWLSISQFSEGPNQLVFQAGRSTYIPGDVLASIPDPGAMAAAAWYRAAALAIKEKYNTA